MSSAPMHPWYVSPEEYLAGELTSEIKHEYEDGRVYAMSGASNRHNRISMRTAVALANRLNGTRCYPCNSDVKVRVRTEGRLRFFYPDVSVTCRPNEPEESFEDQPSVIIEVLSPSTERIDFSQKREAYCSLPSLDVYVLVESEHVGLTIYRRTPDGWQTEVLRDPANNLSLPTIGCEIPLAEIYADSGLEPSREVSR